MKKFLIIAIVFAAVVAKADNFSGLTSENRTVKFCGTAEIVSVQFCECGKTIKMVNTYRSYDSDTIIERVPEKCYYNFLNYLSVGDRIDFCLSEDCDYFHVKRVRLKGGDHSYFISEDDKRTGKAKVLRVTENGALLLENGIVITFPKAEHQKGDMVNYRLTGRLMIAKEIKKRVP